MSTSNGGPGGVRNLRAMFENKASDQSSSPPSRGRSPNGSVSSSHSRPVSKVRASFVAVDKLGEDGQQLRLRTTSDLTMDGTNENAVTDGSDLGEILKGSPFEDRAENNVGSKQDAESNGIADRAAAMVKKIQQGDGKPLPTTSVVDPSAGQKIKGIPRQKPTLPNETKKPSAEATKSPTEAKQSPTTTRGPIVKPRGGPAKILGIMESAARAKEARAAALAEAKSDAGADKPTTDSASKTKEARAANPVRPRGGVSKIQGVMASSERAKQARASAAHETSKDPGVSPTASRLPRASLPMRKLPGAATAPTAASAAKTDAKPAEAKTVEKKTVTKAPPRVANITTAASLAKKNSRASLNTNDGAKLRTSTSSRPADDNFLARMTKPTASSAQKAHEKAAPQSPPHPKPASTAKGLAAKPSRKSLSRAGENKENETEVPEVPAIPEITDPSAPSEIPPEVTEVTEATEAAEAAEATETADVAESQPAEVAAST